MAFELHAEDVFPDLPTWLRNALWRAGVRTREALAQMPASQVQTYGRRSAEAIAAWQATTTDLCPHCHGTGRVPKEP